MSEIGKRLRRLREQRGWNQSDLARRAQVSSAWVSRVESGVHDRPSMEYLSRAAKALRVDIREISDDPIPPFSRDEQEELEQLLRDPGARVEFAAVSHDMRVRNWSDADKEFVLKALRAARDLVNARSVVSPEQ